MYNPFIIQEDDKNIRDKRIDTRYQQRYVGEQSQLTTEHSTAYRQVDQRKVYILSILFLSVFIVFFTRLVFLQIKMSDEFLAQAEVNRVKIKVIPATRGIMYDRNGEILVKNEPTFALQLTPSEISPQDLNDLIVRLHERIDFDDAALQEKLETYKNYYAQPLTVADNLDYYQALDLEVYTQQLKGVDIVNRGIRYYPAGEYTAHILGYMGKIGDNDIDLVRSGDYQLSDYLGKAGLEKYYENTLKGTNGKKEVEVNVFGKELQTISELKPVKGQSLILNINAGLQRVLYKALSEQIERSRASKGAAVALDPNTGGILAAVSLPGYDDNYFSNTVKYQTELSAIFQDENQPLFFRALQGEYPSGSTFKPIVASAALSEGVINSRTTVLSVGGIRVAQWFFPDWKAGGHGVTNVIKALAESVNTFFYYIGGGYNDFIGLGIDRITAYAKKFGLTQETNIDYPQESTGFLPSREWKESVKQESWYIGDTYNVSIGQGDILVTPLQMALAYAAIANDGTLYQPHFVKAYKDEENEVTTPILPRVLSSSIIDSDYLQVVRQGLRSAVTDGSARYLNNLPVAVAGKTGTAQVGGDKNPHAWFVGFGPYEKPEIVLAIIIENGGEGSSFAVPAAYDTFAWYFSNRSIDE